MEILVYNSVNLRNHLPGRYLCFIFTEFKVLAFNCLNPYKEISSHSVFVSSKNHTPEDLSVPPISEPCPVPMFQTFPFGF